MWAAIKHTGGLPGDLSFPCTLERGQHLLKLQPLEGSYFSGGLFIRLFTLAGGRARTCSLAL